MVCATASLFRQVTVVLGGTARIKGSNSPWPWAMVTVVRGGPVVVRCALALGVALRFAKSVVPRTAPRIPPTTRSKTRTTTRPATTTPDRKGALSIKSLLMIKIFYLLGEYVKWLHALT